MSVISVRPAPTSARRPNVGERMKWGLAYLAIAVVSAPIWLFWARVWLEGVNRILTAPLAEIICVGMQCQ